MKAIRKFGLRRSLRRLGPGLITGATYSQTGAPFGLSMLWTVVFTLPLRVAIQRVSACVGDVTRRGLAANTRNVAADIAAMAEALRLPVGCPTHVTAVTIGRPCLVLQVFLAHRARVRWLQWLTLALLSCVALAFAVHLDWRPVASDIVRPRLAFDDDMLPASRPRTMGPYVIGRRLRWLGWTAAVAMAATAAAMLATW